jgi:hypothetical protein
VNLTLRSTPRGVPINLDGEPHATPFTFPSVVGFTRHVDAPLTAALGDIIPATFTAWSDGGAAEHDIVTPATKTALLATYD